MLIDWFTVGAQALNFLILAWLMKRFLYQPILDAIDAREKRIAAELADADARKREAQTERDAFRRRNEEFDQRRAELLSQAADEAKVERKRLFDEARGAAADMGAKRQETLRNDAGNLSRSIRLRTQHEVFAIARRALADLATTSLEERLGEVFTRRLGAMDGQAKAGLATALASHGPRPRRTCTSAAGKYRFCFSANSTSMNGSSAPQMTHTGSVFANSGIGGTCLPTFFDAR